MSDAGGLVVGPRKAGEPVMPTKNKCTDTGLSLHHCLS